MAGYISQSDVQSMSFNELIAGKTELCCVINENSHVSGSLLTLAGSQLTIHNLSDLSSSHIQWLVSSFLLRSRMAGEEWQE